METLTILCVPISAMGHVNATLGLAVALKKRGHRVVFATEKSWKGKIAKYGFEEELYEESETTEKEAGKQWSSEILECEEIMRKSEAVEKLITIEHFYEQMLKVSKHINAQLENIIATVKPDVIIEDFTLPIPALFTAGVPCVRLYSVGPLYMYDDPKIPPFGCGLPLNDDREWERCRQFVNKIKTSYAPLVNEWLEKEYPQCPKLSLSKLYHSTNLNIYMYPKALVRDYLNICPLGEEFINIDHCIREPFGEFEMPKKLQNRPGKLVFLSLGSLGSSLVEVMKRLISILSKSKHKFIVAMGYRHNEYTLAENMWGEPFVPQLAVLPHVDLVLTHGGNNTFTESLYFGKPLIVLPLLGDQHDNAQRAVEMNIGLQFNPFTVSGDELNEAIERLLSDPSVAGNVQRISNEMKMSKSMEKAVDKIEYVVKHPKFPTIV